MKRLLMLVTLTTPFVANAFNWPDLWQTKDQQAKKLMDTHQYSEAFKQFKEPNWRATAAYRAEQYKEAAAEYERLNHEEAYYNQGNALAHIGQYEQALQAYGKTLKINPQNQDALYNKKIIEKLLKKHQDKQQQDKQEQDKQEQDKQKQDKQKQDKQKQDKQKQDKQKQDKQKQDKQEQDKQEQDKQEQNKQKQDKQQQDKQQQDKQQQDKQQQDKQQQDKQQQDKQQQDKQQQDKQNPTNAPLSNAEKEKQRANKQWLKLVPDDPGGLLREKFLRDHLRRQNGWNQ